MFRDESFEVIPGNHRNFIFSFHRKSGNQKVKPLAFLLWWMDDLDWLINKQIVQVTNMKWVRRPRARKTKVRNSQEMAERGAI
jgi:hypothetical protein